MINKKYILYNLFWGSISSFLFFGIGYSFLNSSSISLEGFGGFLISLFITQVLPFIVFIIFLLILLFLSYKNIFMGVGFLVCSVIIYFSPLIHKKTYSNKMSERIVSYLKTNYNEDFTIIPRERDPGFLFTLQNAKDKNFYLLIRVEKNDNFEEVVNKEYFDKKEENDKLKLIYKEFETLNLKPIDNFDYFTNNYMYIDDFSLDYYNSKENKEKSWLDFEFDIYNDFSKYSEEKVIKDLYHLYNYMDKKFSYKNTYYVRIYNLTNFYTPKNDRNKEEKFHFSTNKAKEGGADLTTYEDFKKEFYSQNN